MSLKCLKRNLQSPSIEQMQTIDECFNNQLLFEDDLGDIFLQQGKSSKK